MPRRKGDMVPLERMRSPLAGGCRWRLGQWQMRCWQACCHPLVIRVPKGYLAVAFLVLVALLGVSYGVGYNARMRQERAGHSAGNPTLPLALGSLAERGEAGPVTAVNGQDPRRAGLSYFVLASYPESEAIRLMVFLRSQGVDSVSVRGHNSGLFQVVATQGFAGDLVDSPQVRQLQKELRQLGRSWKAANAGKGDDLSSLHLEKYVPVSIPASSNHASAGASASRPNSRETRP